MNDTWCTKLAEFFTALHTTQGHNLHNHTSDTNDQQHKTSNLKLEVPNFRYFRLKILEFRDLGGKNGISGIAITNDDRSSPMRSVVAALFSTTQYHPGVHKVGQRSWSMLSISICSCQGGFK